MAKSTCPWPYRISAIRAALSCWKNFNRKHKNCIFLVKSNIYRYDIKFRQTSCSSICNLRYFLCLHSCQASQPLRFLRKLHAQAQNARQKQITAASRGEGKHWCIPQPRASTDKTLHNRCWDQCAGPMTSFFPSPKCNVAVETPACSPATVCVDAINTCGMRYGGYVERHHKLCLWNIFANGRESCYNTCDGPFTQQVTAPACPTTALARTTHSHHANTSTHSSKKLANTSTVTASYSVITPAAKLEDHGVRDNSMAITMASSCTPHTLCVDAINSCGSRYGG